jgi:hypothetical protein
MEAKAFAALTAFLAAVSHSALEVGVTELKVDDRMLPGDVAVGDEGVADLARRFLVRHSAGRRPE